jgi:hypothetical protein
VALERGYAMELRLRTARTTKDIDISLPAEMVDTFDGDVIKRVQESARIELVDFFTFVIGESQLDLNAAPQGGARYPVVASIAGRVFTKFHLDVGIGDAVVQPTELMFRFEGPGLAKNLDVRRQSRLVSTVSRFKFWSPVNGLSRHVLNFE